MGKHCSPMEAIGSGFQYLAIHCAVAVCVPSTYQDQQKRVAATHVSRGCDVSPFQATSPTVKLI
jgi:hypothetical protein